jgi:DNA-directed RNA polymerase subunit beta'
VKGKVQAVQPAPQGGYYVRVGGEQHYVPEARGLSVKKGDSVEKGQALSGGTIDPRQLLVLRGLSPVQDLLTGRLFDLLKTASSDIKRRNIEVVVKSITNLARVEDPGDHPTWVAGDMQPYSQVSAWNREHKGKKPVKFTPELKSLQMVPLELQEDWIARLNAGKQGQTLIEAAREGWKTNIHSFHPIPAVTYGVEFGKKEKAVKPGEKWRGQY